MTALAVVLGLGAVALLALGIAVAAGLKAWNGWLELRRLRVAQAEQGRPDLADLRSRIRRLEVIADGRG